MGIVPQLCKICLCSSSDLGLGLMLESGLWCLSSTRPRWWHRKWESSNSQFVLEGWWCYWYHQIRAWSSLPTSCFLCWYCCSGCKRKCHSGKSQTYISYFLPPFAYNKWVLVFQVGGPFYPLTTGRRDSNEPHLQFTNELPAPTDDLPKILEKFSSKGFKEWEIVSLLGRDLSFFCIVTCEWLIKSFVVGGVNIRSDLYLLLHREPQHWGDSLQFLQRPAWED